MAAPPIPTALPAARVSGRLGAGAALAVLLAANASAQPVSLDERGLDGVTASTAGSVPAAATGVVVAAESRTGTASSVSLADSAQADARALNLVNAAGADTAQGVNIADRRAQTIESEAAVSISQRNEIVQTDTGLAVLGELAVPAAVVERRQELAGSVSETRSRLVEAATIDRSRSWRRETTSFSAVVDPEVIGLFDEPVSLGGHSIDLPEFVLDFDSYTLDFDFGDDPFDSGLFDKLTSIEIDIGSLDVSGASIALGEVVLDGSDIVVNSPSLTIPDLTFSLCFKSGGCEADDVSAVTVTIEGASFALDPIRLDDANPLGDLGFSFGYAVAGDGTITFDSGDVEFAGSIPIDLGSFADLDFDIDVPGMDVFSGFLGDLDLPVLEIPVDLSLDLPPGDVVHDIAGEACSFSNGQQQCTPLDRRVETVEESTERRNESETREVSRSETHSLVEVERTRGELRVGESRAETIVLRNSELADTRYRLVIVSGDAQRGMRVLNGVNSATAIVGNGLNLGTERAGAREAAGGIGSAASQTNSFRQIGGL